MYNIPSDVYTSYPKLSRALPLVSKQLSQLSIRGACNSLISKEELINYVDESKYTKIGIMYIQDKETHFEADMNIYFYHKLLDIIKNGGMEHIRGTVEERPVLNGYQLSREKGNLNDISENIKKEGLIIYPDIKTSYKIFSKRSQCLQYPNYAKQMTKIYLNNIISDLNDHLYTLSFYLVSNMFLLNMSTLRDPYIVFKYNIDDNYDIIEQLVKTQINEVNNYIDERLK